MWKVISRENIFHKKKNISIKPQLVLCVLQERLLHGNDSMIDQVILDVVMHKTSLLTIIFYYKIKDIYPCELQVCTMWTFKAYLSTGLTVCLLQSNKSILDQ